MQKSMRRTLKGVTWKLVAILVGMVAILAIAWTLPSSAYAEGSTQEDGLKVWKTLEQHLGSDGKWDGDYTLSINVEGTDIKTKQATKTDVIIVQDVSGSMEETSLVESEYGDYGVDSDGDAAKLYYRAGFLDYRRVEVGDKTDHGTLYIRPGLLYQSYDGARYEKVGDRLSVAKEAINSLAEELLSNNNEEQGKDLVQVALVTFEDEGKVVQGLTNNLTTFTNAVNKLTADGGTNWESGLKVGNENITGRSDAQKIIIFVSDGDPTYYLDSNGNVAGNGSSDTYGYCYSHAVTMAKKIVGENVDLYSVSTFGNVTKMQQLVEDVYGSTEGKYYRAEDKAGLIAAFKEIVYDISKTYLRSYSSVRVADLMSSYAELVNPDNPTFTTTKSVNGATPVAITGQEGWVTYNRDDATVNWDINKITNEDATFYVDVEGTKWFILQPNTVYTLSFLVHPTQNAFDLATDFERGDKTYDETTYPDIIKNEDGTFSVRSNKSATVTYNDIKVEEGKDPVVGDEKEKTVIAPEDSMPVFSSSLKISKKWANDEDIKGITRPDTALTAVVERDDGVKYNVELTSANNWTATVKLSAGYDGHTYQVTAEADKGNTSGSVNNYEIVCDPFLFQSKTESASATQEMTFTNSFSVDPLTETVINVSKTLQGRDWKQGETFSFTLTPKDGAPVGTTTNITIAAPESGSQAKGDFGSITYTKPGTYVYEVTEDAATAETDLTYDASTYTVTVVIAPDGEGGLKAESVTYSSSSDTATHTAAEFVNVRTDINYGEAGGMSVSTMLKNYLLKEGLFTYTVSPNDTSSSAKLANKGGYANTAASADTATTIVNGDGALIESLFNSITFKASDVNKTYAWTISQSCDYGASQGYTLQASHTVKITLKKVSGEYQFETTIDSNSPVVATVSNQKTAEVSFVNEYASTYDPNPQSGEATNLLDCYKVLTGAVLKDGQFTFNMVNAKDSSETYTATNDADGNVAFKSASKITRATLLEKVGKGYATLEANGDISVIYNASEVTTGLKEQGITPRKPTFNVKVTFSDDGQGTLTPTTAATKDNITFYNLYGEVELDLDGRVKVSTDAGVSYSIAAGQFTVNLYEGNLDEETIKTAEPIQTKSNIASGKVDVDPIKLLTAGTYDYTVALVVPAENPKDGITYDTELKHIQVVVEDNEGVLTATVTPATSPYFEFNNSYTISDTPSSLTGEGEGHIQITKTLSGRTMKADEFTFVQHLAKAPIEGVTISDVYGTNDVNGVVSFGSVTYTVPGDYEFIISEQSSDPAKGIGFDSKTYTVIAHAEDQGDGTLAITYSLKGSEAMAIEFANTYGSTGELDLNEDVEVTIQQDGKDLTDAYDFILYNKEDPLKTVISSGQNATAKAGEEAAVSFVNKIPYTNEKLEQMVEDGLATKTIDQETGKVIYKVVYRVEITSELPHIDGIQVIDMEVTIVDDLEGNLVIDPEDIKFTTPVEDPQDPGKTIDDPIDEPKFELKYTPEPTSFAPTGTVTTSAASGLTPADIDGKLTYTLWSGTTQVGTAVVNDKGSITLSTIENIEAAGTYTYTVKQAWTDEAMGGFTLDSSSSTGKTITVKVEDVDGLLTVKDYEPFTFTNTYAVEPITIDPVGPSDPESGKVGLGAKKVLAGHDMMIFTDGFALTVKGSESKEDIVYGSNDADGNITLNKTLEFSAPAEVSYILSEVLPDVDPDPVTRKITKDGITYDSSTFEIKVTVIDNGEGKLVPEVEWVNGTSDFPVFYNTYNATGTLDLGLQATKTLTGRDMAAGEFTFDVIAVKGEETAEITSAKNLAATLSGGQAKAKIDFSALNITTYDLIEGVYRGVATETTTGWEMILRISERTTGLEAKGITPGKSSFDLVVQFADDGKGNLTITPNYTSANLQFTNAYSEKKTDSSITDGQVTITKKIDSRSIKQGEVYTFVMTDNDGLLSDSTGTSDASGVVKSMSDVTFSKTGTYYFTLKEKVDDPAKGGITYTQDYYTAEAVVTDPNPGQDMNVVWRITQKNGKAITEETLQHSAVFTNGYEATGELNLEDLAATLKVSGGNASKGLFTFNIVNDKASETVVASAANAKQNDGETKALSFSAAGGASAISYTLTDLEAASSGENATVTKLGAGQYRINYTAKVATPLAAGWTATAGSFKFSVDVTDNGDGTMSVVKNVDTPIAFALGFNAPSIAISGAVVVDAAPGTVAPDIAGKYTYGLYQDASCFGDPILTATNDANGNIVFDSLEFTQQMTYNFYVKQSGPELPGVTMDTQVKQVSITVSEVEGNLVLTTDPAEAPLFTFSNTYEVEDLVSDVSAAIPMKKTFVDGTLVAEQFEFELLEDEEVVATGFCDANGKITLTPLTYSEIGEHVYTMIEVIPEGAVKNEQGYYVKDKVVYGNMAYAIAATVTDNHDGTLSVKYELKLSEEQIKLGYTDTAVFLNEYVEDEPEPEPTPIIPLTGDFTWLLGVLCVALAGGGVLVMARLRAAAATGRPTRRSSAYAPRTDRTHSQALQSRATQRRVQRRTTSATTHTVHKRTR